jgi:hypothetical protein
LELQRQSKKNPKTKEKAMPTLSTSARNAACNAIVDLLDAGSGAGTLVFRTSGDVEVATLTFSDPAFGASSNGVATASSITEDLSATGGTMTKATLQDSDANIIMTCTAGTSGEFAMTSAVVGVGVEVAVDSLTVTMPAS